MALRTRRNFLLFAANDASAYADNSKDTAKRGDVAYPEPHPRRREPVPGGAGTHADFLRKCVGCLKCIPACPRGLLHISSNLGHLGRPALDFRHGWCYPECNLCAAACPAGALGEGVTIEKKLKAKVGIAEWNREACLAEKGVKCNACLRHCPVKAITHAKDGTPVVNADLCIGCGACEYHCPARPWAAIHVEGRS